MQSCYINKLFRVIIAGGRDFDDYELLKTTVDNFLSRISDKICIVCGMARGADTLGEQYAKERGFEIHYFPADWKTLGRSAGYIRNMEMAQNADALVVFWDGKSRGTQHMIKLAKKYNLDSVVKYYSRKKEK